MSHQIRIEIPAAASAEVVHRFRNFGEDVHRELRQRCSVDLSEVDAAIHAFIVRGVRSRDLGIVNDAIQVELKRHHFEGIASLIRS